MTGHYKNIFDILYLKKSITASQTNNSVILIILYCGKNTVIMMLNMCFNFGQFILKSTTKEYLVIPTEWILFFSKHVYVWID